MRKDADSGAAERTMRPSPERSAGTAEPKPRPLPQRAAEGAGLRARQYPKRAPSAPEFPGCRPMPLLRCDLDTHDGRFEYWDGDSGIAWVCEPTSPAHESASQRLAGLSQVIAGVRGSAIECYGTMDLLMRDAHGERRRILQADQTLYLCPPRAELLDAGAMVVGEHHYPDVVLEVDHRTDVRRGKLGLYEEWGFPEVWVEVPEGGSSSRPAGRPPGVTIHLLEAGAYRTAAASRAFPGWRAEEIHTALNEAKTSKATGEILSRVGRALGARRGTGPDDTPWLRMQRQEARAGITEAFVREILASRGISVSGLRLDAGELAGLGDEAVAGAALRCEDASDFRVRLRGLRR